MGRVFLEELFLSLINSLKAKFRSLFFKALFNLEKFLKILLEIKFYLRKKIFLIK